MILERTDYSARIAYVDYNGVKVYENYQNQKPKTHSDNIEFAKNNAPKIVAGIKMIAKFFENLKKENQNRLNTEKNSLSVTS